MKDRRFKTQFDLNYKGSKGEVFYEPSQTRPDMSLTVKELLLNHSRGLPLDANSQEGYYFDTEIPHFNDLTEAIEYKEALKQQYNDLEKQIKDEKATASKNKKEAAEKLKQAKIKEAKEIVAKLPKESKDEKH